MPVREIDIAAMVNKIFDATMDLMPSTSTHLTNMLVDKAHKLWTQEAQISTTKQDGNLSRWGEKYASTLQVKHISGKSGGTAKVYVDERDENYRFVEYVEEGIKTWSIKDALKKGKAAQRNLRKSKTGMWYVHVPFRYRTPGAGRATSSVFAGIMPQDVYEKAKRGEKIGGEYGKLAGLAKVSEGIHSQYLTFRTVSEKSKGWQYPEKPPQHIFEKVQSKVESMVEKTIANFIEGFLKDIKKEGEKK